MDHGDLLVGSGAVRMGARFAFDPGRGTAMLTGRPLWSIWWRL